MVSRFTLALAATGLAALSACAPLGTPPGSAPPRIVTVIPTENATSNQEIARTEQALAAALNLGAAESHPLLVARTKDHLDKAKAAWKYAYEEEEDDLESDDDEYVAALHLSLMALADAEVTLASAQATREEARVAEMKNSIDAFVGGSGEGSETGAGE